MNIFLGPGVGDAAWAEISPAEEGIVFFLRMVDKILSWMYGYVKDLCSVSSDICLQVV